MTRLRCGPSGKFRTAEEGYYEKICGFCLAFLLLFLSALLCSAEDETPLPSPVQIHDDTLRGLQFSLYGSWYDQKKYPNISPGIWVLQLKEMMFRSPDFFVARLQLQPAGKNLEKYNELYEELPWYGQIYYVFQAKVLNLYYKGANIPFQEGDTILLTDLLTANEESQEWESPDRYENSSECIIFGYSFGIPRPIYQYNDLCYISLLLNFPEGSLAYQPDEFRDDVFYVLPPEDPRIFIPVDSFSKAGRVGFAQLDPTSPEYDEAFFATENAAAVIQKYYYTLSDPDSPDNPFNPDNIYYDIRDYWRFSDAEVARLLNGETSDGGLWAALAAAGVAVLAAVAVLVGRKKASR